MLCCIDMLFVMFVKLCRCCGDGYWEVKLQIYRLPCTALPPAAGRVLVFMKQHCIRGQFDVTVHHILSTVAVHGAAAIRALLGYSRAHSLNHATCIARTL